MSIKYTRDGKALPDHMYNTIKAVQNKGGKVFFATPFQNDGECQNCGGSGKVIIQIVTGGPFTAIPSNTHHYISHEGKHYTANTQVDNCPSCNGTGNPKVGKASPRPINIDMSKFDG